MKIKSNKIISVPKKKIDVVPQYIEPEIEDFKQESYTDEEMDQEIPPLLKQESLSNEIDQEDIYKDISNVKTDTPEIIDSALDFNAKLRQLMQSRNEETNPQFYVKPEIILEEVIIVRPPVAVQKIRKGLSGKRRI